MLLPPLEEVDLVRVLAGHRQVLLELIYSPGASSLGLGVTQVVLRRLRQALRAMRQPNIRDRGAGEAQGVRRGLVLVGRW